MTKEYYKKDMYFKRFTKKQIKTLKNGCPRCNGKLYGKPNSKNTEMFLWCEDCDISIDSDGGYIN